MRPSSDGLVAAMAGFVQPGHGTMPQAAEQVSEEEIAAAERELGVVFPVSYRAFLRHFGAASPRLQDHEMFGLPRECLWGDLVMMNQLAPRRLPGHYVKFMADVRNCGYYLDTSRMNSAGECPVAAFGTEREGRIVADNFLDFLRHANRYVS